MKKLILAAAASMFMLAGAGAGAAVPSQIQTDAQKKCYLIQWPSGRLEWICVDAAVMSPTRELELAAAPAPKPPPTPCLIYCDPEGRCKLEC